MLHQFIVSKQKNTKKNSFLNHYKKFDFISLVSYQPNCLHILHYLSILSIFIFYISFYYLFIYSYIQLKKITENRNIKINKYKYNT